MRDDPRAARDVALAVIAVIVVTITALSTKAVDHALSMAPFGFKNLNGIIPLLLAVPVATTVFSFRRYRDASQARQELAKLSMLDSLTGLPNRRAFQDKLKEAIALSTTSTTAASLLLIDLDRFKEVNDSLGHDAGDDVLRRIAEQLRAILEKGDFIARIGGDEFASLVFADTRHIQRKAALLARQILRKLQIEVPAPAGMIRVGCTLGIASCPGDAIDAEGLMALADRLLYVGKKDGRNQVVTADQLAPGA